MTRATSTSSSPPYAKASPGSAASSGLHRPAVGGVSPAAANRLLDRLEAQLAPRMQLVAWADEVARHPELVGADRVHPTPAGARVRARRYANTADQCQS
jgi:hypothetical protein